MARIYLVLTFLGALLPYGAFVPWLFSNGLNISLLWQEATVNPISIFAWLDVLISAVTLLCFIGIDGKRNNVAHRFFAMAATVLVGVSCGLPLYLYLKEKQTIDAEC